MIIMQNTENSFPLQLITMFNHIGLCMGVKGTKSAVDRLRALVTKKAAKWRNAIQVNMQKIFQSKYFRVNIIMSHT